MKKAFFIIGLTLLAGCSKEPGNLFENQVSEEVPELTSKHEIPLDVALNSLQNYLLQEQQETKSSRPVRKVGNVGTVYMHDVRTKSAEAPDCDKLLYVVNFEDDLGYAVLAADDRVPADVLAVTEQGSASTSDFHTDVDKNIRITDPFYPTTGPGIIVDENDSSQIYMNPNTFQLYDAEEDDYFVGDFSSDVSSGGIVIPKPISSVNNMIVAYALGGVTEERDTTIPGGTPYIPKYSTTISYQMKVEPLLSGLYSIDQGYPYNSKCPIVKNLKTKTCKIASAGCVPLAVAKILVQQECSYPISYEGLSVNCQNLNSDPYSSSNEDDWSTLLRWIGDECGSWYFYQGTFTFPNSAKRLLKRIGYTGTQYKKYNDSQVINSLENSKPLMVVSVPENENLNYSLKDSHGWNIDGYKIKTEVTITEHYFNGVVHHTDPAKVTETMMVHCDFGWGGLCNGYFVSGIFDLGSGSVEYDNPGENIGDRENTNYKWHLKTITL